MVRGIGTKKYHHQNQKWTPVSRGHSGFAGGRWNCDCCYGSGLNVCCWCISPIPPGARTSSRQPRPTCGCNQHVKRRFLCAKFVLFLPPVFFPYGRYNGAPFLWEGCRKGNNPQPSFVVNCSLDWKENETLCFDRCSVGSVFVCLW